MGLGPHRLRIAPLARTPSFIAESFSWLPLTLLPHHRQSRYPRQPRRSPESTNADL